MRATDFFLFCSGVSMGILKKCPESERIKHISIGASVFFTGILAVISSYFAFSLIFEHSWSILAVSFFWGLIIFNLDRYIVATLRKNGDFLKEAIQISPRLALSAIIALVVAKPLELQIFKSEIQQNLNDKLNSRLVQIEKKYTENLGGVITDKKNVDQELKEFFNLKEFYYQEYKCECDGTCGTGKSGIGSECNRKKEKYEASLKEYNEKEQETRKIKIALANKEKEYGVLYQEEIENIRSNFSTGLLARINALNDLKSWAPWFITLLILFVEIAPVLTKLFSEKGVYDELLIFEEKKYKLNYLGSQTLDKSQALSEKQREVREVYYNLGKELTKNIGK